jgi:hypothetical protein
MSIDDVCCREHHGAPRGLERRGREIGVLAVPRRSRTTLRAQVAITQLELERIRRTFDALRVPSPTLHARVEHALAADAEDVARELADLAAARSAPDRGAWLRYAEVKARADSLIAESHDLVQGALVRAAGVDEGLCEIADRLLDGLSEACSVPWGRLCVPADSEFVSDLAQVVRLRAGDVSVWHLPVAVHEFGHFVGPRLGNAAARPFAAALGRYRVGEQAWSYTHELFADVFAIYAGGPAFAAACVISRFHPGDAGRISSTHPPHARRIELMLRVLDRLDAAHHPGAYRGVTDQLRETWWDNVEAAGLRPEPAQADVEAAEHALGAFLPILDESAPHARYGRLDAARAAEDAILAGRPATSASVRILDVLNGAWLSRLDRPVHDQLALRERGEDALALTRGLAR